MMDTPSKAKRTYLGIALVAALIGSVLAVAVTVNGQQGLRQAQAVGSGSEVLASDAEGTFVNGTFSVIGEGAEDEAKLKAIEEKGVKASKLVLDKTEVKNLVKDKYSHWSDFYPYEYRDEKAKKEQQDLVVVTVVSNRVESGDLENGFNRSSTGMFEILAEVKDDKIVKLETKALPDFHDKPIKYNYAEKAIIQKLQAHEELAALIKDKNYMVGLYGVPTGRGSIEWLNQGCEVENCVAVSIKQLNQRGMIQFAYEASEDRIINLGTSEDWQ